MPNAVIDRPREAHREVHDVRRLASSGAEPTDPGVGTGIEESDGLLAALARVLCFGLAGLWWSRPAARRRRAARRHHCVRCRLVQRRRRRALFITAGLLAALAVVPTAAVWLTAPAACPTGPAAGPVGDAAAAQPLRNLVTSPASGAALLYATARGAQLCVSPQNGLLVALTDRGFPRAGVTVGRVFITKDRPDIDPLALQEISRHEAWHGQQWAAGTALAGPAALPAAYSAAEFAFPGAQNPFERHAGLSDGGYVVPDAVCPAPVAVALWIIAALSAVVMRLTRRPAAHGQGCRRTRSRILDHAAALTQWCRTALSPPLRLRGSNVA